MGLVLRRRNVTTFLSLPRELRDKVYRECLTSHSLMVYTQNNHFCSQDNTAVMQAIQLLNPSFSTVQIAREACEIFYQHNKFQLQSSTVGFLLKNRFKICPEGEMLFRPALWLKNITFELEDRHNAVRIANDFGPDRLGLNLLLTCPRLKHVAIQLTKLRSITMIVEIAKACYELQKNVGKGLRVYGRPLGNRYPDRGEKDISWMLETPDAAMKKRVEDGEATLEDKITVGITPWITTRMRDSERPTSLERTDSWKLDRWYMEWWRLVS